MSGWNDLLHSSSKLIEQAAPSAQLSPLQLDQLEALSKKLKAKTLRAEAHSQFIAATSITRQYGAAYLRHGDSLMGLEYYVQTAASVGGGQLSWIGRGNVDQQRQRTLMLKQLLTEILMRKGGIYLLLGSRGAGEEGQLGRFLTDGHTRQQFLLEAARWCQDAGLYDKIFKKEMGRFQLHWIH